MEKNRLKMIKMPQKGRSAGGDEQDLAYGDLPPRLKPISGLRKAAFAQIHTQGGEDIGCSYLMRIDYYEDGNCILRKCAII